MALFATEDKKKNRPRRAYSEALAALDASDKDFPSNPGQFAEENKEEFKEILEKTLGGREFKAGQVVEGTVVKTTDSSVIVDINYKSEGRIPLSEFQQFNQEGRPEPGQKVEVYIEQIEDKDGIVVLSRDKANIKKAWQDIIRAKENDEVIQGKVIAAVKGGLSVDIGIKAFLPGSQMDTRPVRKLDSFVGRTMEFKIIKMNHKRGNIVLSRKAIAGKERENLPAPSEIKEGAIVKGIVKNITDYGAFVDLGDRDGLLHITDMSWSRIERPDDLLKVGQEVELKILKFDEEKNRISLGLKQLNEEKWQEAVSKYEVGSIVNGQVSAVVDYGAFILLEDGLEGLVHLNEISWMRKVKNPSSVLKPGDKVKVKIIDIKTDSHKLSLSIKQTQENPWLKLKEKYTIGEAGEFEIVSISDFGLFVKVNDMVDGLVRSSDISWMENINPREKYKVGDKIKAQVLDINPEEEKFSLGIKQLGDNPWSLAAEKFPVGSRHEVEVSRVAAFGAFVKLQEGIEGLIHVSELSSKRVDKPQDFIKPGDKVKAEILSIDKDAKKIALSIRLVESNAAGPADGSKSPDKKPAPRFMENFFAKALKKSIKAVEDTSEESASDESSAQNKDSQKDAKKET